MKLPLVRRSMSGPYRFGAVGLWFGVLAVLLPAGCLAESSSPEEGDSARIRAAGEAVVVVVPDRAWVDMAVVSRDPEAAAAVSRNASESERVTKALRGALGKGPEIASAGYSLSPNYRYVQGQGQQLDGFIVRNRLRVTLRDVSAAGGVIDAASLAGASEIQQVSYGLADDGPARREALAQATRNGLERARVMAEALGLKVVRVLSVEDSGASPAPVVREVTALKSAAGSAAPTRLEPGGIHVRAGVTVYVEVGP